MSIGVWKLILIPGGFELEVVNLPQAAQSMNDVSAALPGGAYTSLRTYGRCRGLRLQAHFARLEQTARLAGHDIAVPAGELRAGLGRLAQESGLAGPELRFRITLDLEAEPGRLYIAAETLTVPAQADYEHGVAVVTTDLQRLDPKAKLTRFISRAAGVRGALAEGINEAVMINPAGFVMEGLSSNFFGLLGNEVRTAEEGVLAGITRGLALEAAAALGMPVRLEPLHRTDLRRLDEAFLTGTSRGILPVRRIDALEIEAPGAATSILMRAFNNLLEAELETFV